MLSCVKLILFQVMLAVNIRDSLQCPGGLVQVAKAAYKSGEIDDQSFPITLNAIQQKLKESGVFDGDESTLTEREKKELSKLFEAVEIMTTSRNRQPQSAQNMFSLLRLVERAVKKQLKEGQISESLADKFHWEKLSIRLKRAKPAYILDKTTNMRVFNTNS